MSTIHEPTLQTTLPGGKADIRPIQTGDAGRLCSLMDQVYSEGGTFITKAFHGGMDWIQSQLSQDHEEGQLLIAEADNQVVGWIWLSRSSVPVCRHTATLSMGVDPKFRKQGIGRHFMEAGLAWAKDVGVEKLTLEVRSANLPAIILYRKLGFREEGREIRSIKLPSGKYEDKVFMGFFI